MVYGFEEQDGTKQFRKMNGNGFKQNERDSKTNGNGYGLKKTVILTGKLLQAWYQRALGSQHHKLP